MSASILSLRQDYKVRTQGHSVVRLGQETVPISLGTPGSNPAPEATLVRGAARGNQAKTENYMALVRAFLQCGTTAYSVE
jgi:hypothetical protein